MAFYKDPHEFMTQAPKELVDAMIEELWWRCTSPNEPYWKDETKTFFISPEDYHMVFEWTLEDEIKDICDRLQFPEPKQNNVNSEVISSMTSSDIMEIIIDKQQELNKYIEQQKWDRRLYKTPEDIEFRDSKYKTKEEKELRSLIQRLKWEISCRNNEYWQEKQVDLSMLRNKIPILDVIGSCISLTNYRHWDNIKCPLPDHKEKTGSFHIYEQTNTWKCFGCQKWWSQIDFLMYFYNIPLWEAIKLFIKFNN